MVAMAAYRALIDRLPPCCRGGAGAQRRILCGAAQRYEDPTRTDDPRVRRQAQYASDDDTLPYDRELIRSGGASSTGSRRRQAKARRPSRSRASKSRRPGSFLRTIRNVLLLAVVALVVGAVLLTIRAAAFNDTVSSAPFHRPPCSAP